MPLKDLLLTPGPSMVPYRIRARMAEPAFYSRGSRFRKLYKEIRGQLQRVLGTKADCLVFAGSGTLSMETALVNSIAPDKKAVLVSAGKWGERLVEICKSFKLGHEVLKLEYGRSPSPEQVAELAKDASVSGVFFHLCETSTGAKYDVKGIAEAVRKVNPHALIGVDAISGGLGMACPVDEWGVDFYMTGSQKALMLPPGLAILTVSERAWNVIEGIPSPTYYACLKACKKNLATDDTPYTPATSLMLGLNEALKMIEEEGFQNVLKRHAILAEAARAAAKAWNLKLLPDQPSEVVTCMLMPTGIESGKVIKLARDRYGVTLADGQGSLKGKIVRIAHMGYCSCSDLLAGLAILEIALVKAGVDVRLGSGVAAAQQVFSQASDEVVL